MKKITLTRNGQDKARDIEKSTMHADGLKSGDRVLLRIKGDCTCNKPTEYQEYKVDSVTKSDRFDGKCSDIRFVKVAAVVPEVVMPPEPVPRQPDLPAGGVPVDDGKVAAALSEAWRVAKRVEAHAVVAALRFGAVMAVAERAVGDGRGRGRKNEGFKGWLAKHCPEISYLTAIRWRKLAVAAAAMMKQEPERLQLTLDEKWWARNGGEQSRSVVALRGKLFAAESMRALAALVFDYHSEDRRLGREEGSTNEERTDADRAREDWGVWIADLSDAWALKSIPLLAIDDARTAYNSMRPLVAALKRRLDEEK